MCCHAHNTLAFHNLYTGVLCLHMFAISWGVMWPSKNFTEKSVLSLQCQTEKKATNPQLWHAYLLPFEVYK